MGQNCTNLYRWGFSNIWGNRLLCYCVFPATIITATCSDLNAPTNGMIDYDMETMDARPVNTVATYTCVTGYMLGGDMTRTCGATGEWSGTVPTCKCESIQWIWMQHLILFCCSDLSRPHTNQWDCCVQWPHHPQSPGLCGCLLLYYCWVCANWWLNEDMYCHWMEHWRWSCLYWWGWCVHLC